MIRVRRSWTQFCCVLVWAPVAAWAADPDRLPATSGPSAPVDEVRQADQTMPVPLSDRASFRPLTPKQIVQARQRVITAAEELSQFLANGTAENATAWKQYLMWDELHEQLRADADSDGRELGNVLAPFYSGAPGLELPPFVSLREAILSYRQMIVADSETHLADLYQQQLQAIDDDLEAGATSGRPVADLAARLVWLEQLGQAPELVAEVRGRFGKPNLLVSASAETVSSGFSEPVSQTASINEMILNTHICGTAHTEGEVTTSLVPCDDGAILKVMLTGVANSETVGRQSPVRIYSQGVTQVFASTRLFIDADSVRSEPAVACCSTDNRICRIRSDSAFGSRMIEKIAWKRARQQEWRAEQISARRAERRVAAMMDQQSRERVEAGNARISNEIRGPLRARNIFPRKLRFWTTAERLHMAAVQGRPSQLAAPSEPLEIGQHDITAHVHESMIFNTAVNAIGGLTVTDERAQQLVKDATGEVPEQLEIKQDEDPWSITFDVQRPLRVEFDNDQIAISIRGRHFSRGNQEVRQTIQIAANYQLSIHNARVKLTRVGDIQVTYPDHNGDRLSLAELRNKTFLTNKFEGLFKPELGGDGIQFTERWEDLRDMSLNHVSSRDGWLSMGWN